MQKSIGTREQELLKRHRLAAGLTQINLVDLLDVPRSRISDYETGARRMDLPQLKRYVEAMGTPLTVFVEQFVELYHSSSEP